MAIQGDSSENEATTETQADEVIKLLKAILLGIEIMTDKEDLIDNIEA